MSTMLAPKSFGALLRSRRTELGFSTEEVADDLGVSAQFLWRVEHGMTGFPAAHLKPLAKKLGMDPEVLVAEYIVPVMASIYKRAGLPQPSWKVVPVIKGDGHV